MAAVCEVCGKHPSFGMSVSHSHRRTKRRWNPNIQTIRAVVGGTTKRVSSLHRLHQGRQGPEGRPAPSSRRGLTPPTHGPPGSRRASPSVPSIA